VQLLLQDSASQKTIIITLLHNNTSQLFNSVTIFQFPQSSQEPKLTLSASEEGKHIKYYFLS